MELAHGPRPSVLSEKTCGKAQAPKPTATAKTTGLLRSQHRYWLEKAEWYELPHVIIFDSWRHLFRLLNETDVALVRQRMHAGQTERAAAASRAWNNELTAMQVAWKKNPTRALRFSNYDSAMRTLYGRSTARHDDESSYVVSRLGREYNLSRLHAFKPYDGHPEATIPLSPNGITHAHTITLMVLCSPRAIMHSPRAYASAPGHVLARTQSSLDVPRSSESLHGRACRN
jgi:hypothetical protein